MIFDFDDSTYEKIRRTIFILSVLSISLHFTKSDILIKEDSWKFLTINKDVFIQKQSLAYLLLTAQLYFLDRFNSQRISISLSSHESIESLAKIANSSREYSEKANSLIEKAKESDILTKRMIDSIETFSNDIGPISKHLDENKKIIEELHSVKIGAKTENLISLVHQMYRSLDLDLKRIRDALAIARDVSNKKRPVNDLRGELLSELEVAFESVKIEQFDNDMWEIKDHVEKMDSEDWLNGRDIHTKYQNLCNIWTELNKNYGALLGDLDTKIQGISDSAKAINSSSAIKFTHDVSEAAEKTILAHKITRSDRITANAITYSFSFLGILLSGWEFWQR